MGMRMTVSNTSCPFFYFLGTNIQEYIKYLVDDKITCFFVCDIRLPQLFNKQHHIREKGLNDI